MNLNAVITMPLPENAPYVKFESGSPEREKLEKEIAHIREKDSLPILRPWINGPLPLKRDTKPCIVPHDLDRYLAEYACVTELDVRNAIATVTRAKNAWQEMHYGYRLSIFSRAAHLLQEKYFFKAVAEIMEDYSKTPHEAVIDVNELIDFWKFNAYFASKIYAEQPLSLASNFNTLDRGPHTGFIYANGPNNFWSIEGNLPTAPLMMGNAVIWKPSSDIVYSAHTIHSILLEAGLPTDILAVLHGNSQMISGILLNDYHFSGVHFTGGTETFQGMIKTIGTNASNGVYRNILPKMVGETGGKNFIVAYNDAVPQEVANAITQSGFGYQGQKCSANSRVYIPKTLWGKVRPLLRDNVLQIFVGDPAHYKNYMGSIINESRFKEITGYVKRAREQMALQPYPQGFIQEIIEPIYWYSPTNAGYFIKPIIIVVDERAEQYEGMTQEIFGPVVTIMVLPDKYFENDKVWDICERGSRYALTGSVATSNIYTFLRVIRKWKHLAGNWYNYGTAGAVVYQQPFGGAGMSGTNHKAGSPRNLLEWVNDCTISVRYNPPTDFAPAYLDK